MNDSERKAYYCGLDIGIYDKKRGIYVDSFPSGIESKSEKEFYLKGYNESNKRKDKYYDWVKKLGQYHLSIDNQSETLCGMPMLGNNYAKVIPKEERTKCIKCFEIAEARSLT